jgi:hypothetical protein
LGSGIVRRLIQARFAVRRGEHGRDRPTPWCLRIFRNTALRKGRARQQDPPEPLQIAVGIAGTARHDPHMTRNHQARQRRRRGTAVTDFPACASLALQGEEEARYLCCSTRRRRRPASKELPCGNGRQCLALLGRFDVSLKASYKSIAAGGVMRIVPERYSSQACSCCGCTPDLMRKVRMRLE